MSPHESRISPTSRRATAAHCRRPVPGRRPAGGRPPGQRHSAPGGIADGRPPWLARRLTPGRRRRAATRISADSGDRRQAGSYFSKQLPVSR